MCSSAISVEEVAAKVSIRTLLQCVGPSAEWMITSVQSSSEWWNIWTSTSFDTTLYWCKWCSFNMLEYFREWRPNSEVLVAYILVARPKHSLHFSHSVKSAKCFAWVLLRERSSEIHFQSPSADCHRAPAKPSLLVKFHHQSEQWGRCLDSVSLEWLE